MGQGQQQLKDDDAAAPGDDDDAEEGDDGDDDDNDGDGFGEEDAGDEEDDGNDGDDDGDDDGADEDDDRSAESKGKRAVDLVLEIASKLNLGREKVDGEIVLVEKVTEFYWEIRTKKDKNVVKMITMGNILPILTGAGDWNFRRLDQLALADAARELKELVKHNGVFSHVLNYMSKIFVDDNFPLIEKSPMCFACGTADSEKGEHLIDFSTGAPRLFYVRQVKNISAVYRASDRNEEWWMRDGRPTTVDGLIRDCPALSSYCARSTATVRTASSSAYRVARP